MAKPDFMIVGAMKCGTSTLQAQLAHHDDIFMTTPKEPNFFSDDDVYAQGFDWYQSLYSDSLPSQILGEASTHYTKLPTHPRTIERIKRHIEHPLKFIYVIRNPVDRAISHYMHEWSEGRASKDVVREFDKQTEFVRYGCFGEQIAPYIDNFGLENVHLTSLEQIKRDPEKELAEIGRFVSLDRDLQWSFDIKSQNVSANRARRIPLQGLLIDNSVAKVMRQTLVPKGFRTWIRNKLTMKERPTIPVEVRKELQGIFWQDRSELAKFFPNHEALKLCYEFEDL